MASSMASSSVREVIGFSSQLQRRRRALSLPVVVRHLLVDQSQRPAQKAEKGKEACKKRTAEIDFSYLRQPLHDQLATEDIGISQDAYQIIKYHGSYQQNNHETKGPEDYQFILSLMDDLSASHDQGNLRATPDNASRCTEF